ncbi:hypothetical protein C7M84_022393 [Penaeus vannamei]|uniref:Uncharacterized protein n=1 Tax=Penaeus vannamei TaxID=6689 RepID=A0A3R7QZ73_PENVA|nr:hypothetical protein C7M84_022393 [Penaeus vannamei]
MPLPHTRFVHSSSLSLSLSPPSSFPFPLPLIPFGVSIALGFPLLFQSPYLSFSPSPSCSLSSPSPSSTLSLTGFPLAPHLLLLPPPSLSFPFPPASSLLLSFPFPPVSSLLPESRSVLLFTTYSSPPISPPPSLSSCLSSSHLRTFPPSPFPLPQASACFPSPINGPSGPSTRPPPSCHPTPTFSAAPPHLTHQPSSPSHPHHAQPVFRHISLASPESLSDPSLDSLPPPYESIFLLHRHSTFAPPIALTPPPAPSWPSSSPQILLPPSRPTLLPHPPVAPHPGAPEPTQKHGAGNDRWAAGARRRIRPRSHAPPNLPHIPPNPVSLRRSLQTSRKQFTLQTRLTYLTHTPHRCASTPGMSAVTVALSSVSPLCFYAQFSRLFCDKVVLDVA